MLGAISRVFTPGCKFEVMLCLVGGQGAGKSTFFRFLAMNDDWFSDDLKRLDDENVARKMQGHWIIEMSEMIATANARSIEDIKSFLSRQKETYKVPYATEPEDRLRQCVFGGTSNTLDFLPLDRSGNRRFIPILCRGEAAEVHILEDEDASRAYIMQMWAEVMQIYLSGDYKLSLNKEMQRYLMEHQQEFMPEDTDAGMIAAYLDDPKVTMVCTKLLYEKALNKDASHAKPYEFRQIADIMNNCFPDWTWNESARLFYGYGKQKYWSRPESDG
jgi:predicted P-loop ATPase